MQKNLALLRRENAILRDSLATLQQQASLQEQVVHQKQAAHHQYQAAHEQQQVRYHQQPAPVNHEPSRNHQPFFQQQRQNQHASNGYCYPYMGPVGQDPMQNQNFQFPPPQVPRPGLFPNVQHPFRNMQPHIAPQIDSHEPSFLSLLPQFQSHCIAPVYGNTVYNYQAFDMSRLMGHQQL
ncbi:hypothetical protein KC19_9G179800 [Ceratodon purpureus]|uniref:Uncharacterized protein n=1 Tax=Ceratodon purpureus TaxID=3225 RepID=A0A8T0GWH3_CERPU|nr:hypothetical protein KC19_9G179800 [Ceratodon purpureus]